MKLQIEQWIDNNEFSENVNILFQDSIVCYKSGANRASLLFSYLAFLTILKERIIGGVKPQLFPQGEWNKLISTLQNEDLWEAQVFTSTQQQAKINQQTKDKTKDPIFNINDNLRLQIKYWKDRRNDCAHYKDNTIETYHVESFWAFIKSNLSKITIEGGLDSLINKFHKHFDPTITPPDKDITPLVKEIEYSVDRTMMKHFWDKLLNDSEFNFNLGNEKQELIRKSLEVNSNTINESLILLIKENQNYLLDFLSNHPDLILRFNFSTEEVRKIWKTKMNDCDNPLGIYTHLLINDLIPKNEIDEANKVVINSITEYFPKKIEHEILSNNQFLKAFKEEILENRKFIGRTSYLWVNDKVNIISGIIKNYPADKDIALKLIEHYEQDKNSDWLLERFNKIFKKEEQLTTDYKSIFQSSNSVIPTRLKKYFD